MPFKTALECVFELRWLCEGSLLNSAMPPNEVAKKARRPCTLLCGAFRPLLAPHLICLDELVQRVCMPGRTCIFKPVTPMAQLQSVAKVCDSS